MSPSLSASRRPNRSAAPPGVDGATMRTGRAGQSVSAAGRTDGDTSSASSAAAADLIVSLVLRSSLVPDHVRHLDDARALRRRRMVAHDGVALVRAREAALRADREPRAIDEACAVVDAGGEPVGRLELGDLGGYEAEHHDLVVGQCRERREAAGAL